MFSTALTGATAFFTHKERAAEAFAALIFLAYILLIALHPQVPALGDYGDWTYQGVLLSNHLAGVTDSAHTLKHYPVPNSLTTVGIGLLAVVFPWAAATKIWLCIYIATAFASARMAICGLRSSWIAWLLLPVLFLGLNFWWGFLNFQFGVCWVLVLVALLVSEAGGGGTASIHGSSVSAFRDSHDPVPVRLPPADAEGSPKP